MKKVITPVLWLSYLVCFSQQNFINVPSGDVTSCKKVFFQEQLNFNESIQSNTTIDLGIGKGFELGVNILGLDFDLKQKALIVNNSNDVDPYNPLIGINGLKRFNINKYFSVAGGFQAGINFRDNRRAKSASLFYSNFSITNLWLEESKLIIGMYYNSRHYGGPGQRLGAWCGAEVPFSKRWHLMAESILGNNALSYTSVGVVYYVKRKIPLTLGVQIPNIPRNSYALVFEFTFSP